MCKINLSKFIGITLLWFSVSFGASQDAFYNPQYFCDPAEGRWSLLNPAFIRYRDSLSHIMTEFAGPFKDGNSLSALELAWPLSYYITTGLVFSGSGNFVINSNTTNKSVDVFEKESFNRGIFGVNISVKLPYGLFLGSDVFYVIRDYNSVIDNVPAYTFGLVYDYKKYLMLGLSAGYLSGGKFIENDEEFASLEYGIRLLSERLVYSGYFHITNNYEKSYQNILKIFIWKNIAARVGYNKNGWNAGARFKIEAARREGYFEYFLGEGLIHNVHFNLRLENIE